MDRDRENLVPKLADAWNLDEPLAKTLYCSRLFEVMRSMDTRDLRHVQSEDFEKLSPDAQSDMMRQIMTPPSSEEIDAATDLSKSLSG